MDIKFEEMATYIQKAAKLDAIVSYIKSANYISKNDILAIAGKATVEEETTVKEEDNSYD